MKLAPVEQEPFGRIARRTQMYAGLRPLMFATPGPSVIACRLVALPTSKVEARTGPDGHFGRRTLEPVGERSFYFQALTAGDPMIVPP